MEASYRDIMEYSLAEETAGSSERVNVSRLFRSGERTKESYFEKHFDSGHLGQVKDHCLGEERIRMR